jgi:glyoxylase-like metal-dependent hydrolase (beta-lactamase superfamily II)
MRAHTEGSAFFHQREMRALFSGDTLLTARPPLVFRSGLSLPYPTFCVDPEGALSSLARFAESRLEYSVLCAGHGSPIRERASERVQALLAR